MVGDYLPITTTSSGPKLNFIRLVLHSTRMNNETIIQKLIIHHVTWLNRLQPLMPILFNDLEWAASLMWDFRKI